jgi:DNA-binding SARP family transcriptional activator/tetratricopeptide (TPR) repeat protein
VTVEHRLLGPVETWVDGCPLDLGYAQQRCVFAVLLAELNKVIPARVLIARVWGDGPPPSAQAALYAHIARLRHTLAGAAGTRVVRRAGGYVAEADPETVDLHRFRLLVAAARAAADGRAACVLDQALDLWRGVPFSGLASPWLNAVRGGIEAERIGAVLDRNEAYLRAGRHGELIGGLTELCAAHPLDERLAGQLMRALYRSGRQADALSRYHQIRRHLTDEFGVDPQPGLRKLFQQILRSDPGLMLPAEPRSAGLPGTPAELPHNIAGFAGREAELTRLHALVRRGGRAASHQAVSIAAIDGVAGAGKTALAVRFAHQVAHEFPDGQLFLDLGGFGSGEPPATPSAALERLLEGLGADPEQIPRGLDEQSARYRSALAGRKSLIVLDNAASADQVRPLLPGDGSCLVVVTSRNALTGLVAVDGAVRIALDVLSAGESVELLASAVGASRVAAEPAAAAQLAGLCGHLPLALRIAAARTATHPHHALADLAAELAIEHQRLDLLTADEVTSVRAAFCWSYRTLPATAARAFRLLGLHPGTDIDAAAAAALTADPDPGPLDALVAACLLQATGKSRYRMHDLVRLYASERVLADDGEADRAAAVERLLTWYLHTADAADRMLIPGRRRVPLASARLPTARTFSTYHDALAWCDAERPNLVAVTRQAAEAGDHATAWQLPVALWGYLMVRKPWSQWVETHQIALASARHLADGSGEAHVLGSLAFAHLDQRRYSEAIADMSAALRWCRSSGDRWGAAIALLVLGIARRQLGDQTAARRSWHKALTIWRQIGDDWGAAHTLNNLGDSYRDQGHPDMAIRCLQEALEILARAGDRWGQARTLTNLGSSLGDLQRHREAIGYLTRALRIRREITDQRGQAETLDRLATVLLQARGPARARTAWRAALVIFQQLGDPQAEAVKGRLAALATEGLTRDRLPPWARLAHGEPERSDPGAEVS